MADRAQLADHSLPPPPPASLSSCGRQARQAMEREFNNLLALGTDRKLEDVSARPDGALGVSLVAPSAHRDT